MIHPVFRLIASEPQMVADHVQAYAELVAEELGSVTGQWKRRALLYALAMVLVIVATVLIGIALMLWAAVPIESMTAPWLLIVVPAIPTAAALWSYFSAKSAGSEPGFKAFREQLAADAAMLRSVGSP